MLLRILQQIDFQIDWFSKNANTVKILHQIDKPYLSSSIANDPEADFAHKSRRHELKQTLFENSSIDF